VETRDDDTADVAPPPGWVLNTPTRRSEVWSLPAFAAVLAVLLALLGTRFGETLGLAVCMTSAVIVAAGAVAMAVAGGTAYDAQTLPASWRLHVVRVVVGVGTAAVVAVGSLIVGLPFGFLFGGVAGVPMAFRYARAVPRTDRIVVAWASAAVAGACAVLVVLARTIPDLGRPQEIAWTTAGPALGALSLAMAIVQVRVAARTPPEQDGPQRPRPNRVVTPGE
jgi:hypothetical protein